MHELATQTMIYIKAARDILLKEGGPLHVTEIDLRAGPCYPELKSIAPEKRCKSFSSKIASHYKAHKKLSTAIFAKVPNGKGGYKKGVYTLVKRKQPGSVPPRLLDSPVSKAFLGRAGEYAVCSELLYRGFNPALVAVDHGVDIVAHKGRQYFHIQVKTANQNKMGKYGYRISRARFDEHNNGSTFYVFVIRRQKGSRYLTDFVILSSSRIQEYVDRGLISASDDNLSLQMTVTDGGARLSDRDDLPVNDFDAKLI